MDFSVSEDHQALREGVAAIMKRFDAEYWLARDEDGEFPESITAPWRMLAGWGLPCLRNTAVPA